MRRKKNRKKYSSKQFAKDKEIKKYIPKVTNKVEKVVLESITIFPESIDSLLVDALFSNGFRLCKFFSICDFEYLTYWKKLTCGDTLYMHFLPNGRTVSRICYYDESEENRE